MRIHYIPMGEGRTQNIYAMVMQHLIPELYVGSEFQREWFDAFMFGPDVTAGGIETQLSIIEDARRKYDGLPFYFYGIHAERPGNHREKFNMGEWVMHLNQSEGVWVDGEDTGDFIRKIYPNYRVSQDVLSIFNKDVNEDVKDGYGFVVEPAAWGHWRQSYFMDYLLPRAIKAFDGHEKTYLLSKHGMSRTVCEEYQARHALKNCEIASFDQVGDLIDFTSSLKGVFTTSMFMTSIAQVSRTPLTGYGITGALTDKLYAAGAQLISTDVATPPEILAGQIRFNKQVPKQVSRQAMLDSVKDLMRSINGALSSVAI